MNDPGQLQSIGTAAESSAAAVNWFQWLLGLFFLVLSGIFEVYRRRVDDHQKHHVTREELEQIVSQNKKDSDDKHKENIIRLERIEDRVNALPTAATTVKIVSQSPRKRRDRK